MAGSKEVKNIAIQAMEINEQIHESAGIKIKGGVTYTKVVHRIEALRRAVGYDYGIQTTISQLNGGYICTALISSKDGFVVGSGSSYADKINKEKALEKMETTAIGRALASLGLGGGEYASAEEIETFQERYEKPKDNGAKLTPDQERIRAEITAIKAEINSAEEVSLVEDVLWANQDKILSFTPAQQDHIKDFADKKKQALRAMEDA